MVSHSVARRLLFPVYGIDQLLLVAALLLLTAFLSWTAHNFDLWLYLVGGGYVGFVITMSNSTPAELWMEESQVDSVRRLLDSSSYLRRIDSDCWRKNVGRLRRWKTDDLKLDDCGTAWRLKGRLVDLENVQRAFQS